MPTRRLTAPFVSGVVFNIRFRWPEEMKPYSDLTIACMYDDFSYSDDVGNNDEKLPMWFHLLPEYEKEAATAKPMKDNGGWLVHYEL